MKRFKISSYIILLCLSFLSNAYGRTAPVRRDFTASRTFTKLQLPYIKFLFKNSDVKFHYGKPQKNTDLKSLLSKGIKRKATSPESDILPDLYHSDFVTIKSFMDNKIHGLSVLYHIQRHSYLHLYQLF